MVSTNPEVVPQANEGKPLVFLHGVGLDRSMWREVELGIKNPTLSLDLPGHGNQPPLTLSSSLEELAKDVKARIPYDNYYLVGFSLGALVAQQIASSSDNGVCGLVSVSSVCNRTESEKTAVRERLATAERDFESSIEASIDRWYPQGSSVAPSIVEATRETLRRNNVESFLHAYRVFATGDAEVFNQLSQIKVPVLAVTGEQDPGSSPAMTHRLVAALPNAEAVIVPNARHMFPVTHPNVLIELVESFISKVESTP
ncbi:alpha/beta fold hydrolase [Micrococcoides hystricis]|uniref:Alpha/beta fold hydrolase n=1 Tax=Micrococcoides hystricis TaxID=1572761 RepID=A0ABV6PA50_9MICC